MLLTARGVRGCLPALITQLLGFKLLFILFVVFLSVSPLTALTSYFCHWAWILESSTPIPVPPFWFVLVWERNWFVMFEGLFNEWMYTLWSRDFIVSVLTVQRHFLLPSHFSPVFQMCKDASRVTSGWMCRHCTDHYCGVHRALSVNP